jgi:hypothetical protein
MSAEHIQRLLCGSPEAARALDVSTKTLLALTRDGDLPFIMIGRVRKYAVADLEYLKPYLDAGTRPPKPPPPPLPINDHFGYRGPQRILETSRTRARLRGLEHTLTLASIEAMADRSRGYCELTGIPFSDNGGKGGASPWQASLDRKEPAKGYTPENCRLVCYAVNLALNEWGEDVLMIIARALVEK